MTYSVEDTSLTRELGRTWCPGGLFRETDDWVGTSVVRTAEEGPAGRNRRRSARPARPRTTDPDPTNPGATWAPTRWRPASHEVLSVDPNFGEGPMSGTPAVPAPVHVRSGLVLQATSSVADIVAIGSDGAASGGPAGGPIPAARSSR